MQGDLTFTEASYSHMHSVVLTRSFLYCVRKRFCSMSPQG